MMIPIDLQLIFNMLIVSDIKNNKQKMLGYELTQMNFFLTFVWVKKW